MATGGVQDLVDKLASEYSLIDAPGTIGLVNVVRAGEVCSEPLQYYQAIGKIQSLAIGRVRDSHWKLTISTHADTWSEAGLSYTAALERKEDLIKNPAILRVDMEAQ